MRKGCPEYRDPQTPKPLKGGELAPFDQRNNGLQNVGEPPAPLFLSIFPPDGPNTGVVVAGSACQKQGK